MKYIVIYKVGSLRSAFSFDTYEGAKRYINSCSSYGARLIRNVTKVSRDHYEMTLKNGKKIPIAIECHSNSEVRHELSYKMNNREIEVRRFSDRELAVEYAHKLLLKDLGCKADKNEDEFGDWSIKSPGTRLNAHIKLNLIISGSQKNPDYEILGIRQGASIQEIKHAFRELAKKHHPDNGGDAKKFQEINEAYERLIDSKSKNQNSKSTSKIYRDFDMRCFFRNSWQFDNLLKNKLDKDVQALIRSKASGLILRGIIETLIGAVLTIISYSATSPGGRFLIFGGLVVYGIADFCRGVYYYINPKAMLNKVK